MRGRSRKLAVALAAAFAFLVLLAVLAMFLEEKLIYFPEKYPSGPWEYVERLAASDEFPVSMTDVWLTAKDGNRCHAWYLSSKAAKDQPAGTEAGGRQLAVVHFHGNAGNLTTWFQEYVTIAKLGVDVLAVDYRGYGKSEGRPTEQGLYQDAVAAWEYLRETRGFARERIVIYGYSLGGGVAVDLAHKVGPAGLIVQSSFTSIPDMAGAVFPLAPRFLVRTKMESLAKVGAIDCPKLFIHGTVDDLVPFGHGQRLFSAAAEPKQFFPVPGAGHNDVFAVGGPGLQAALQEFLKRLQ